MEVVPSRCTCTTVSAAARKAGEEVTTTVVRGPVRVVADPEPFSARYPAAAPERSDFTSWAIWNSVTASTALVGSCRTSTSGSACRARARARR
ncbi:hypothetical protein ACFFX0_10680 [Citricoccus parietis]|uniref:Uncharacterized protein n=1 Tax=Citricoccus parietis TaxID=592307 RepID=A0ABV5FY75_9MICC